MNRHQLTHRADITVIMTRDFTVGRTDERPVLVLRDAAVWADAGHGGAFVRLPGIATCDGYRALLDNGTVTVSKREADAIIAKAARHPGTTPVWTGDVDSYLAAVKGEARHSGEYGDGDRVTVIISNETRTVVVGEAP